MGQLILSGIVDNLTVFLSAEKQKTQIRADENNH